MPEPIPGTHELDLTQDRNVKTLDAMGYYGMSQEDQLIVDAFLDAVGVLPIQCVSIRVLLHPNWDQLGEGDVDPNG